MIKEIILLLCLFRCSTAAFEEEKIGKIPLQVQDLPLPNTTIIIDGHVLPAWFTTAASAGMMAFGAGEVFFGYKLFRVTLFILGGAAGGIPTFLISWDQIDDPNAVWIGLGLGVMAGLIAGALSFFLYKLGVFLCGAALGVTVAIVLNLSVLYKLPGGNAPFIVAAVFLGLGFGFLSYYYMRYSMIAATSIVGSYAFIRSVGYFGGNYPANEFDVEQELQNGQTNLPWQIYAYFAGWIALCFAGIFVQIRYTAKKKDGDGKDENELAFENSADVSDLLKGKFKKGKKKRKGGKSGKKNKSAKSKNAEALLDEYDDGLEFGGQEPYADEEDDQMAVEPYETPSKLGIMMQPVKSKRNPGASPPPASIQW